MKLLFASAITHAVSKARAYYELKTVALFKLHFSFGDVIKVLPVKVLKKPK